MSEKKKTFKDRYQDEEYKEKHLKYINEKILCECGKMVARVGMAKHKRCLMHQKRIAEKTGTLNQYEERLKKLEKMITDRTPSLSPLIWRERGVNTKRS